MFLAEIFTLYSPLIILIMESAFFAYKHVLQFGYILYQFFF